MANHEKKCKVVKLPTKDTDVGIVKVRVGDSGALDFLTDNYNQARRLGHSIQNYHLYILSDDKYLEGDWIFINGKAAKSSIQNASKQAFKKIIATTDTSLNLPRPSDRFIKKYCEAGGIDEVMVEYTYSHTEQDYVIGLATYAAYDIYSPKVAPDNTITIRKVKDSWNKEEVINLCAQAFTEGYVIGKTNGNPRSLEDWIKENL